MYELERASAADFGHTKVVAAGLTGTFAVCYIAVLGLLTVTVVKILRVSFL
jgi:hypothetical protein